MSVRTEQAPRKAPFVVIESCDGGGSTTQRDLLCQRISDMGLPVEAAREPSDGLVGRMIREVLRHDRSSPAGSRALQMLFVADRSDHLERTVLPAIRAGRIVVCDRYELSTVAYHTASEPAFACASCAWFSDVADDPTHAHWIEDRRTMLTNEASAWHTGFVVPDATIVLSVTPEVARKRRTARGGTPELLDAAVIQKRVCAYYTSIGCGNYPRDRYRTHAGGNLIVVDGDGPVEHVAALVWSAVAPTITRSQTR